MSDFGEFAKNLALYSAGMAGLCLSYMLLLQAF